MSPHTFLFADLAGFTALTEAHGDDQAADLVGEFSARVRELLPEYGGEDMKTIGDAVMLRCDSANQAIGLGMRIVEEIAAMPGFPVVRVGLVGLSAGDFVEVKAFQSSGGGLNVDPLNGTDSSFSMTWLAPGP